MSLYTKTLEYFLELSKIPRRSHEEKKVRRWLVSWAKKHDWEYEDDEVGNLLIRAPGNTPDTLCLQGHMDMVCVAQESHDWSEEGVTVIKKNGVLWWDKTTLWADNGIGVAAMMAVAEMKNRPSLELLFTMGEEVGLVGAHDLDLEVNANYGINLDWSSNLSVGIGCGGTLLITCRYEPKKVTRKGTTIKIRVSGLAGGHSGIDIDKWQWNALIELTKILCEREDIVGIADIKWGDADNAIPRSTRAIVLYSGDMGELESWLEKREKSLQKKFKNEDIGLSVKIVDEEDAYYQKDILNALSKVGSGVQKSLPDTTPLSSWNLGKIRLKEGRMKWWYFLRTNILGGIAPMKKKITDIFGAFPQTKAHPISYELDHETPVWYADSDNEFIQNIAQTMQGKKWPEIPTVVTHATVEVGILADKYPGTQWVSIGATCHNMHTTREHIVLSDLEEFCERLEKIIHSYT
jgi:dipeptidase D